MRENEIYKLLVAEHKQTKNELLELTTSTFPDSLASFFAREQAIGKLGQTKEFLSWLDGFESELNSAIQQLKTKEK